PRPWPTRVRGCTGAPAGRWPSRSSLRLPDPGWMEGRAGDLGRARLAPDLDVDLAPERRHCRRDVPHSDVPLDGRPVRAGGDDADRGAVTEEPVAVARYRGLGHLEADQAACHAAGAMRLDGVPPDEIPLGGLDHPAEPGLQGVARLVDVVA